jgi:predicted TIM-barrel fold metal-dependent hydrolase
LAPYTGPVIDTHHHIWQRKDVSWLADPPVPRMFGDYAGIRRDYSVGEYMADVMPQGVVKSVHVTANWGLDRALDETRWLQSVADESGFPHGIVVQADLAAPDLEQTLKLHKQSRNVRGVRHMLYWDTDPVRQAVPRPDYCNAREFRRGFALLEKYNLSFELQIYASQAKYAVNLIKAFPDVRMILVHAGMLTSRRPNAIAEWRAALKAMATFPNLHVKLSGLGMYSQGIEAEQAKQVIHDCIDIFGVHRTIYGSNFPLERLYAHYSNFFARYRAALSEFSDKDQSAVFHDNAVRFYRL